jgi:phage terminase large subunit GpA-like protein
VCGSQTSKTELLLNISGCNLDDDPSPVLYIGPTKSNVDGVIEPRVAQMLRSAKTLWVKTEKGRKAHKLVKKVAGVTLRLAWAGSPTELASQPAKIVLVDEVDRMKPIPGEGDPVRLSAARTATYPDSLQVIASSPTAGNIEAERHPATGIWHWKLADPETEVISPVWRLWQEGTRFEWAVPCPHCGEYFVPRLRDLKWPEGATPRVARTKARVICPTCGAEIEERDKAKMNAAGHFLAPGQNVIADKVVGELPESDTASFWISGLMSPWKSFGERAAEYVSAVRSADQEQIRTAINTEFGECYAFKGEAPPPSQVRTRCGDYKAGELPPEKILAITCGVDVQKTRLIYAVRAWGRALESWLIDYGEIHGETEQETVWHELAELRDRDYGDHQILRMGIDSGYRPGDKWRRPDHAVYSFCMENKRAVPTKGRDRMLKPLSPALIDVTWRGKVLKQGLQLWHLDSDHFKSWIQQALLQPLEQRAGRFWVPSDVDEDYCLQMTAETRVQKPSGLAVWIRVRPENHYFDCEVINLAMAYSLGLHRSARKAKSETTKPGEGTTPPDPPAPRAPVPQQRRPAPRVPNWVSGWRK